MHIPQYVITVVLFAIVYPLLMRVFARKYFSWAGSLIAVAVYAAVMAVFSFTAVGTFLALR